MSSPLCGCHQCGGGEARARAILARRVVLYAPFVRSRYTGAEPTASLRNRAEPVTLYSHLILAAAASREGI